jgi:hypothetical protein
VVKYAIKLVPLSRVDDRGRVSVHNEQRVELLVRQTEERDWRNLRGKPLYNRPYTVREFYTHFLAKFSLKIFRGFYSVSM